MRTKAPTKAHKHEIKHGVCERDTQRGVWERDTERERGRERGRERESRERERETHIAKWHFRISFQVLSIGPPNHSLLNNKLLLLGLE